MSSKYVVASCTFTLIAAGTALAHDVRGVASPRFPVESRISSNDLDALIANAPDEDSRYVYQVAIRWTPARTLTGCFVNGDQNKKQQVDRAKDELLNGTNVNIVVDFSSGGQYRTCAKNSAGLYPEDVRVEFDGADGCAAELGTIAKRTKPYSDGYIVAQNPSVFLGNGCMGSVTIKHELLHALGFHHEHQKPGNPCDFRYDVIASRYNWDEATIKNNFDALKNSNAYVASKGFDDRSVMRYDFSQEFLNGPNCVGGPGSDLSDRDWDGLRAAYPMTFKPAEHKARIAKRSSLQKTGNQALDEVISELGAH